MNEQIKAALRHRSLSGMGEDRRASRSPRTTASISSTSKPRMWPRFGVKAAACHLKGRGDFANMFLFEIPPAAPPCRNAISTKRWSMCSKAPAPPSLNLSDGTRRSFEWGPRSMFAIPLNAKHRHFNGSGRNRALIVATTDLPLVMNIFHNEQFIFDTTFEFAERTGKDEYYSGEGDLVLVRPAIICGKPISFPTSSNSNCRPWADRGGGSTNIMFVLADGNMHAHISEMPTGTYKKGHRHGAGAHVMCVVGSGFSLLWWDGAQISCGSTGSMAWCFRRPRSSGTSTSTPATGRRAISRPASAAFAIRSRRSSDARRAPPARREERSLA